MRFLSGQIESNAAQQELYIQILKISLHENMPKSIPVGLSGMTFLRFHIPMQVRGNDQNVREYQRGGGPSKLKAG